MCISVDMPRRGSDRSLRETSDVSANFAAVTSDPAAMTANLKSTDKIPAT